MWSTGLGPNAYHNQKKLKNWSSITAEMFKKKKKKTKAIEHILKLGVQGEKDCHESKKAIVF